MKDLLHQVARDNGVEVDRLNLDAVEVPGTVMELPTATRQEIREVKRDRALAAMAGLILDTARTVEPLVKIISSEILHWAALGASVALAVLAIRQPSWERVGVVVGFMILAPWLLRKAP